MVAVGDSSKRKDKSTVGREGRGGLLNNTPFSVSQFEVGGLRRVSA